jgi:maleamate amidohydrolase
LIESKPWDDVIPQSDIDSFNTSPDAIRRPLEAGVRPAIVVVDMTWEFVDSRFPSGHGDTGWPCVEANARLLASGRRLGIPIYFTNGYADWDHRADPRESGRWRGSATWKAEGADLPHGDAIVDQLRPHSGEIVVHKAGRPSAFFGTQLTSLLVWDRIDTVIVTGMTTSGCVRASVLDAFQYNYQVIVPYECVADRSVISHKVSLFDIHMKYADVISTDQTIDYLQSVNAAARG